jgi:hypothetical protein
MACPECVDGRLEEAPGARISENRLVFDVEKVGWYALAVGCMLHIMKIATEGTVFQKALDAVRPVLKSEGRKEIQANASRLLKEVVSAFEDTYGSDPVGGEWTKSKKSPVGLVYGKIQSGKTRAMITTTAMALDNGFKIAIVLTSNNNRLTEQTRKDFHNGLPEVKVLAKRDLKPAKLELAKAHLKTLLRREGSTGIVVVTSKNHTSLSDIAHFVKEIGGDDLAAIIFDDEGDEASLDTNTRRRSLGEDIEPSRIHNLIHGRAIESVRKALPFHVFVSVTGTPQAILLQSQDSNSKPSFIDLLNPGSDYVGGETFFPEADPIDVPHIEIVASDEKFVLLGDGKQIPSGLKDAICFFVLAATTGYFKNGEKWKPDDDQWDGYKLLCHPSVKQKDHELVYKRVAEYIEGIIAHLLKEKQDADIERRFKEQYENLLRTAKNIPALRELLAVAGQYMPQREIHIINAKTTDDDLPYTPHFNFMIGGNSIGRGLAIKNLLVTHYVREPKIANMDTMYQHARMFGYRKKTLDYTRVFLPYQLYARFHGIYESDEGVREYIATNTDKNAAIPIEVDSGLRPTRQNVIDARATETILPGTQLYPDRPFYGNAATRVREKILHRLSDIFPDYETKGKTGIDITSQEAMSLLKPIKTEAANTWSDKMVRDQLRSIAGKFGDKVRLRFRKAPEAQGREFGGKRVLPTGVLSGDEFKDSQQVGHPVLWIFEVADKTKELWGGETFVYPTVVFPKKMRARVFTKR